MKSCNRDDMIVSFLDGERLGRDDKLIGIIVICVCFHIPVLKLHA